MPKKARSVLSLNFNWSVLSIAAILVTVPIAAGSSSYAADFSFTQIDVPGATITLARGINDAGQIVGSFSDSTGTHGFLATPTAAPVPEPSTLTLLSIGIGFTVLCVMRRRPVCPPNRDVTISAR
jgi:probable HAF family extracellular repeat protein